VSHLQVLKCHKSHEPKKKCVRSNESFVTSTQQYITNVYTSLSHFKKYKVKRAMAHKLSKEELKDDAT